MNNKVYFLIPFFINPFFATIRALRSLNERLIGLSVTLFMGFFGMTTYFMGDNQRYRDSFFKIHEQSITWDNFINSFYDGETKFDVVIPLITYIVSIFTGNEKILFAIFGLIFGYFFAKNINLILNISSYKFSKSKVILFFIIIFSFIYPFWQGTNTVRFVTANTIFFYFLLNYYLSNKKIYYLIHLLIAPLIHFSFLIPTLLCVIYLFTYPKSQIKIIFIYFLISFFLIEIAFEPIKNLGMTYSPSFLETKVSDYTAEGFMETLDDLQDSRSWHAMYYRKVFHYTIVVLLLYIYYYRKKISNNPFFRIFFPFTLFYFASANILSAIPGVDRFLQIGYMFSIVCVLMFLAQDRTDKIFKIAVLPLSFWLLVKIRAGFDFITVGTLISNPIFAYFGFMDDINLITFIK